MKKVITLILAVALVLAMATANFSVNAEPTNYFDMETAALKVVGSGKIDTEEVDGEKVYAFSNLEYRWNSGAIDIRPAVQAAIGEEEYAELTLVFKIKTVFTTDFEGHKTSCIASLRCLTAPDKLDDDTWNSQYEDQIGGAEALFTKYNGNLQYNLSTKRVPVNDEDWTEYTVDMYFEKAVVDSDMTPDWSLCLDQLNGAHQPTGTEAPKGKLVMFDKILIKEVGVYQTEEWLAANPPEDAATPTPTPEPDTDAPAGDEGDADTVEPTATPTVKPTATSKPVATATPDANEPTDDDNQDESNLTWLWIVIAAVVVAGAAVVVVVVLNKKKATPDAEATEEKTEE